MQNSRFDFNTGGNSGTAEDTRNQFVFHNNEEFINFQKCFTRIVWDDRPVQLGNNCGSVDVDPKFYPSTGDNGCDHVKFTFMNIGKQHYQIINNKAFYFQGYKSILIQGDRVQRSEDFDPELGNEVPVLEIFNEYAPGNTPYQNVNEKDCHSYDNDDAIFNIQSTTDCQVDVVVSDIEFRVAFNLEDVEKPRRFPSIPVTPLSEIIEEGEDPIISDNKVPYLYKKWYDPTICPVLFKVYEASSFKMFNVRMYSQFLDFTHVFIHWCENVEITNCKFENYNARKVGGNLWLCQRVKNVKIVNNDFYKYGNDENIGIWGDSLISRDENGCYNSQSSLTDLDKDIYANRHLEFEHIHIKNNRFKYGKPYDSFPDFVRVDGIHAAQLIEWGWHDGEAEWDGVIDVLHTVYFSQHTPKSVILPSANNTDNGVTPGESIDSEVDIEAGLEPPEELTPTEPEAPDTESTEQRLNLIVPYVHYNVSDFVVDANEFQIDSPMRTLMGFTFDNFCNTEGMKITNNLIKYGSWAHGQCQLQDFKIVYDKNPDWVSTSPELEGSNKKCLSPILIKGNTIESDAYPYMTYSNKAEEVHIVLNVENASVLFSSNNVNESTTAVAGTIKKELIDTGLLDVSNIPDQKGFMLLYSREKGGRISMNDNVFRGMICMGSFDMSQSSASSRIELNANNNIFQGTTQFNSTNMQEGIFNFTNNTFFANRDLLLLNEMPLKTLLTLRENVFRRNVPTVGEGLVYYHHIPNQGSEHPLPSDMTIISSGNIFDNINGHKCPYYSGGENFKDFVIYSSNEDSLSDDYYEAKNE